MQQSVQNRNEAHVLVEIDKYELLKTGTDSGSLEDGTSSARLGVHEVSAWPPLPLGELGQYIRILHIHPSTEAVDRDDAGPQTSNHFQSINCTLTVHRLRETPAFTALSYCWGTEAASHEITCNGHVVQVRPNLHAALLQLRKANYRAVWIDAICIKQDDTEEKNHQVNLMSEIYQASQSTVIWLGPTQPHPELVVEYVERLSKAYHENEDLVNQADTLGKWLAKAELALLKLPPWETADFDPSLEPLLRLCKAPWWSRSWVLQEFVLSQHPIFMQGDVSFPARDLMSALNILKGICGFLLHMGQDWFFIEDMFAARGEFESDRGDLVAIAALTRRTHCSDEHDRIYSLLGLFRKAARRQKLQLNIRPSYESSVSTTYTQAARELLSCLTNLDLLIWLRWPGSGSSDLPSWVPAFRSKGDSEYLRWACNFFSYRASGFSSSSPTFHDAGLCLKGYVFDEIVAIGSAVDDSSRLAPHNEDKSLKREGLMTLAQVMTSQREACPAEGYYQTGRRNSHVFWRTFGMRPLTDPDIFEYYESALRGVLSKREALMTAQPSSTSPLVDPQYSETKDLFDCYTITASRRLGRTKRDFYCNVPYETQVGDQIARCAGGRTPFAVRAFETPGGTRYKIWGGCYVEGIMFGEAWKPELVEDMWFD